jgi:DNA topoisomerase-1
MDLEKALRLLELPREVGTHPDTGKLIEANIGRYGPYVSHDGVYANLDGVDEVFTVGLNRAVAILAEKAAGGGKGRFQRAKPTVLKDLGEHPDGGKIEVLSGRYGPYVSHDKVNATLPKGKDPAAVTVQEAIQLLTERVAKGGGKPGKRKAPAKKAAPEKSAKAPAKGRGKSVKSPAEA